MKNDHTTEMSRKVRRRRYSNKTVRCILPMLCLRAKRKNKWKTKFGLGSRNQILDNREEKIRGEAEGGSLWRCWKCRVKGNQEADESSYNVWTRQVQV